jgi:hypothetical protein
MNKQTGVGTRYKSGIGLTDGGLRGSKTATPSFESAQP